ncbi:carbon-nitrogen hydrolase family protein [Corynebacterium aquatimens]|uniref:carbon-nitrogen hydrolase family protein n=1 Tax=Corynebacterium TaxID=1716 RepID=UPI001F1F995F|nr:MULTISPECIES: carbon-nitrogen hydrolase family protein [Corynebacterium]QYH19157.1 carbon-nitrogen hydrolase family protein [Corynebacterium aquatimens]UIZ91966.1 carbon-nitrogen hydrolase family protein [Corynebacterium sp. CNCTC7651]
MKLALLQTVTGADKRDNIALLEPLIRDAAAAGATLIVLPEAASQAFDQGRLDTQAEELDGPFATAMRELARELGVTVVAGMFRPGDVNKVDGKELNRVRNTALITGGDVHKGYDKIHAYDAFNYRESDTVLTGDELVTFTHEGTVVGVAICFDIRFPEQFKELAQRGAEVIVVPTSWADGPGKLEQWRALTAGRALDAGVFIAAAGQARPGWAEKAGQDSGPTGIGHSAVVNPQGVRIAEAGYAPETLIVDIDIAEVARAREALPVLTITANTQMR